MEDLFSEAAIARVARIQPGQTVIEESSKAENSEGGEKQENVVGDDHREQQEEPPRAEEEKKETEKTMTSKATNKGHKFKRKHQEDDGDRTIFVGNVPATIKKKKLKQFFK